MNMTKLSNGFYSYSDSYLKSRNKQDLINYIRTIEKNWENALITNDIQYHNCKRLLAEERNKTIEEFVNTLIPRLTDAIYQKDVESMTNLINDVARELKAGGENERFD
jgi:ribosomal protein S20